jgi:hypothetical protein
MSNKEAIFAIVVSVLAIAISLLTIGFNIGLMRHL